MEVEVVRMKLFQLRTAATKSPEVYEVFKKIEQDPLSKSLLDDATLSEGYPEIVKRYNEYIRKLPNEERNKLLIKL